MDDVTISVDEYGECPISDHLVQSVPQKFWTETGITISKRISDETWRLKADKFVGVARTKTEVGVVTLQIKPKLLNCNPFFLADYAYGQRQQSLRHPDVDQVLLSSVASDPTACLLLWHITAIDDFASRWLRRGYRSGEKVLNGKVQGKLMLSQYVNRYVSSGQNHLVPCRITERTHDTPNNRILKAGLRKAAVVARTLPVPAARSAVQRAVNAALPRFAQVTDIAVRPGDLRAVSTRGPQRHYESVLRTTIQMLENRLFGDEIGDNATDAFLWEMPILFQEAVRGVLTASPSFQLDNRKPPVASIIDGLGEKKSSSRVDPDFVVFTPAGPLLLDTKYKKALSLADPTNPDDDVELAPGRRIKVSRSDVYQMAAYRQHERWPGATVGLIYPVTLNASEPLPSPYRVTNFGGPIHIFFIDVGINARRNLPQFEARLESLASDPVTPTQELSASG